MAALVSFLLFAFIFSLVAAFGHFHYVRPARGLEQLGDLVNGRLNRANAQTANVPTSRTMALLARIGSLLPQSPLETAFASRVLTAAGFRQQYAVQVFLGIKIAQAAVLTVMALFVREQVTENPVLRIVLVAAAGAVGYMSPGFVLERMVVARRNRIRLSLPDVLDLLVVCTEAGCALDMAITKVSQELRAVHPDVSSELSLISLEMLAGTARADALRTFADRTGEPEARKLVAVLIQTDRFGTSVSEALRTQSDFLRTRRRQEAEERAGKVGVKLVFPIFFFCLPSLFIITAGPGILQLTKNLFPMMKQFH